MQPPRPAADHPSAAHADPRPPEQARCLICGSRLSTLKYDMGPREIRLCGDCGSLFTHPLPTADELETVYDDRYFTNTALLSGDVMRTYGYSDYEQEKERNRVTQQRILDRLRRHGKQPGSRLLDYGCGMGAFAAEAVARRFDVELADRNRTCLDRVAAEHGLASHYAHSLADLLPECRGRYDVIAMLDVFEHLADPVGEVQRARELLADDGILAISTTDFGNPIIRLMGRRFEDFRRIQEHTCFLTRRQLTETLAINGFEHLSTHRLSHRFHLTDLLDRSGLFKVDGRLKRYAARHRLLNPSIPVSFGIKYATYARKLRHRPRPITYHTTPISRPYRVSVVMPVYNEVSTIETVIANVVNARLDHGEIELLVVDDGSTDGTRQLLGSCTDDPRIKTILKPRNQGKGSAVSRGIAAATGDIVLIQDADLEYDPGDYHILIQPILDGDADLVLGSRFISPKRRVMGFWHTQGNRLLTLLVNLVTNLNLSDMETCYKAMTGATARSLRLRSQRFNIEPEIVCKAARRRLRIYEVPINYHARSYAEGKKIGLRDVFEAVYAIIRYGILRLD